MPRLTLAICARNAQDIIGECLDSIQRQTVAPDEVIVALDDLSDPTAEVAEAYGARVIASSATGLYEARNAVLDACTTDYLAFTDADCVLVPEWVETAKRVLDSHPDVAAGTGRHPPLRKNNFAAWLHHMWYVVETLRTGETDGVIGGNSYFRTQALREVGGWLNLPRHSAAEDLYISGALRRAGYRIWFDENAAARHNYETSLLGLWRKSVIMGKDIVVMMRVAGWYGRLYWFTMAITLVAVTMLLAILLFPVGPGRSLGLIAALLIASLAFFSVRFRSLRVAFPRWAARWVLIWPYSWGIVEGLRTPLPSSAKETST